ncbi:MAG: metal-dependent hydrolase [Bryobacteraceae bacterium]
MDNLTHSLTGFALARAGFDHYCPRGTLLMILAANAPDLDILALQGGALRYLEWHRGYSHSLASLPVLALLPVIAVAAVYRQRLPWARAWILCCVGVGSHLLIDWTNSYGVRFMLPFSSAWFHLDLNSLYDGWILAALLFAALWRLLVRLVSSEIGDRARPGRGTAFFALAFFLLFDLARTVLHQRAIAQLNSRLYEEAPPLRIAALPEPFTPFRWIGVVETADTYRLYTVNPLGDLNAQALQIFYKPSPRQTIENAKRTEPFRYFLYFARFPVWSEAPAFIDGNQGTRLDLTDLRFGTPWAGSFHCIALENSRHEVVRSWFTYGSGPDLDQARR